MLERITTKILAHLDDLPSETLQRIKAAINIEFSDYDITPKSTDLVLYTGTPQLLRLFLASKKVDGAAKTTLKNYYLVLSKFLARLQKDPTTVTTSDIRMYLAIRESEGLSKSSVSTTLNYLKSFYGWLEDDEYIAKSPARKIKGIKTPKKTRKPLTPEELEKLRLAANALREKALVEFFYSTGCRLAEVQQLNISDIDWKNDSCIVWGKGSKEREVYLNAKARLYLINYLDSRTDDNPALFVGVRAPHDRLGRRAIERVFSKLGEKAGIGRPVFPHLIRHTTATMAHNNGARITTLQKMLGHENLSTTQGYTELNPEEIKAEHRRCVA